VPAQLIEFIPREQQLRKRADRNHSRRMLKVKGYVQPDSHEAIQWQHEQLAERMADALWELRHGPSAGGATVASFPSLHPVRPSRRPRKQRARMRL
jgi:hypothetical protein